MSTDVPNPFGPQPSRKPDPSVFSQQFRPPQVSARVPEKIGQTPGPLGCRLSQAPDQISYRSLTALLATSRS